MYVGMITGNLELLVPANRVINTPESRHTRERSFEEEKRDDSTRQQRRSWKSMNVFCCLRRESLHSEQKQTVTQLVTTVFACEI